MSTPSRENPTPSAATPSPQSQLLDDVYVGNLPRRVAHAAHAILEGSGPYAHGMGVLTAREIMLYDAEAVSPHSTAAALSIAQRRYHLVGYVGKGL